MTANQQRTKRIHAAEAKVVEAAVEWVEAGSGDEPSLGIQTELALVKAVSELHDAREAE